jgi:hypothetical protein
LVKKTIESCDSICPKAKRSLFDVQMKGLRRNEDAMKNDAGTLITRVLKLFKNAGRRRRMQSEG